MRAKRRFRARHDRGCRGRVEVQAHEERAEQGETGDELDERSGSVSRSRSDGATARSTIVRTSAMCAAKNRSRARDFVS
jgi:hypothetical protein